MVQPYSIAGTRLLGSIVRATWPDSGVRFSLSRLLDREAELGDHLLAHHKLLDLAGDGHRKAGNKFDIARDLVMCDLAAAEIADLLDGSRLPVAQPG